MVKKMFLMLICFISFTIFISTLHGQGSKKTITLPSGEVVWDLNGEWDALYETPNGSFPDIVRITQQSSSFVGIKMIGTAKVPKDAVSIKGELDKNGIKKVRLVQNTATGKELDCKGQISEDGDKIIIDGVFESGRIRATFIKK